MFESLATNEEPTVPQYVEDMGDGDYYDDYGGDYNH